MKFSNFFRKVGEKISDGVVCHHLPRGYIRATFLHMGLKLCVPPLKCDPKYVYAPLTAKL